MNRRDFMLQASALVGAGMSADFRTVSATSAPASRRLSRIGLELYSVRTEMAKDPDRTMAAVAKMGYQDVEVLWSAGNFGRTAKQLRAVLDQTGLKAPSAHMSPATLMVGWERSLATAHLLGHQYLIVPSFTPETEGALDDWREWADRFNEAGAKARAAGIWLAFHNEPNHMQRIDGQVPYDVFVQRTDPKVVRLQLDVGNMVMGGGDPLAYLDKYGDRYWSFHIKDVVADRSHDTELGKGTVPLARIFSRITNIDQKVVHVEQEGASDPLASAAEDYRYLKALEF
ncbi:MAG: sugar phosphate isomerase/epimerase [Gemmatimonadaceae bacterium]